MSEPPFPTTYLRLDVRGRGTCAAVLDGVTSEWRDLLSHAAEIITNGYVVRARFGAGAYPPPASWTVLTITALPDRANAVLSPAGSGWAEWLQHITGTRFREHKD